ncbi:MAG: thrombospondin type 3 repeat-containing protein [Myxococcota bacterium]
MDVPATYAAFRLAAVTIALVVSLQAGAADLPPGSVVITSQDAVPKLFLVDPDSGAISVLSGGGVGSGPIFGAPRDVTIGPDGLLYVADTDVGVLRVDPSSGNRQILFPPRVGSPRSLAFDSQGFLYVLDAARLFSSGRYARASVYRIDPLDDSSELVLAMNANAATPFEAPRGLAVTATDQLLIIGHPGRIMALQSDGSLQLVYSMNANLDFMTMDPQTDRPYFLLPTGTFRGLFRLGPTGSAEGVSTFFRGEGPFFKNGSLVAASVDSNGRVYVTDWGSGLFRVDPTTGDRTLVLADTSVRFVYGVVPVPDTHVIDDADGDGVADLLDLCPDDFDPDQEDTDGNRVGDACNGFEDRDGDDFADALDNCPFDENPGQGDADGDGLGDACNDAFDGDGDDIRDDADNCPELPNDQIDIDGDGLGDVCDPFPLQFDNEKEQLRVDLAMCVERDVFDDADGDGEEDATDACPSTPEGAEIDSAGCSRSEFCASQVGSVSRSRRGRGRIGSLIACYGADWRNDDPAVRFPGDCQPKLFPFTCEASPH